jgi:hypothetical protein
LHGDLAQRSEITGGDLALNNYADRACELGQARSWPGECGDPEAHRVIVMMLDNEGFLTAFRMPSQRAIREATAPRLVYRIHDSAGRLQSKRADPKAKDHHGARHCGRRRRAHLEPGPQLHLPSAHGVPGTGKGLVAIPDGDRTGELVIPGREVTRRCAHLVIGQLGVCQPVAYFDRQHSEAHYLIMPHEVPRLTRCLEDFGAQRAAPRERRSAAYSAVRQ